MTVRVCRWGVLGTATIARKFWRSVGLSELSQLRGVASRDRERSREFIAAGQARFPHAPAPEAIDGYADLIRHPEIDAVYVPLPTGLRAEWVIAAAEAGKHVLCEKPCATSLDELRRMTDACRAAGVQFMDNVMLMHSQRLGALREAIDDRERFGDLRRIATQFSFSAPAEFFAGNIRVDRTLEPWGCLGDLGWYNIRIALWAFRDLPHTVQARYGRRMEGGATPVEMSGELFFPAGGSAGLYCSFVTENQQWVHFSGSRGNLWVDDFALPWFGSRSGFRWNQPTFNRSGWDFNYESHEATTWLDEYSNGHPSAQEVRLVDRFSGLVVSGQRESEWPLLALQTQQIMGALVESADSGGRPVAIDRGLFGSV